MSLSMNKLLPLLLIVSALGIAAWALLTLASSSLAIADEDQDTISEEIDDELDVSPKSRRRPVLEKVVVPDQPTPTPEPTTPPVSNTQSRDAPRTPIQTPRISRSNTEPRIQAQVQQYTETIPERNQRLIDRTQGCVAAAKNADLWNPAWDNDPLVLMFVEISGRIPAWSGIPVHLRQSWSTYDNLRVWLPQVRTDEYPWLSRQEGQGGAWSHHYKIHPTRVSGC